MDNLITTGHCILPVVLVLGYAVLAVRLLRAGPREPAFFEKFLAQIVRFSLLLQFVTGIVLSLNMHVWVSPWHHWACLVPILVLVVYQVIRMTHQISLKNYARVFLIMCISIVMISLTSMIR